MMMMMMGQRNLHELLEQDQEPFLLKNYIADRRSRLKNHLRRRPTNDGGGGVLHIPQPTAALLLEAALRIHNQSKPKSKGKKISVGIFDSIFKRLGNRSNRTGDGISVKKSIHAGKSQRSEKSLDLESCCSSSSTSQESPAPEKIESLTSISREKQYFCSSPQSPFRFSLFRTPEFSTPDASSGRRSKEGDEIHEENGIEVYDHQVQVQEEEEKEQCSPVSVLEPDLFQDEEEDRVEDDYESEMESSYEIMQKAKHQLLEKLRRFERLAQLDPLELDKTLFDDVHELEEHEEQEEEDCFVMEVISESGIVVEGMKRLVFDLTDEEEKVVSEEEEVSRRVCARLEKWKEAKRESIDMMVETDLRGERIDGWMRIDENQAKEVGKEIGIAILGELIEELL